MTSVYGTDSQLNLTEASSKTNLARSTIKKFALFSFHNITKVRYCSQSLVAIFQVNIISKMDLIDENL